MSTPTHARAPWRAVTGGVGVALVICLASPAHAALVRVALVVHPVVNVPEAESKAIATELAAAMRKRYDAEIIAGDAVRSKMPSRVPEDCVSDARCIGEVGDRVGADHLLFLLMVRVGDDIQVDATWADIQTGRAVPRDPVQLPPAASARTRVLREVAPTMLPRGEVPLVAAAPVEPRAEMRLPKSPTSDPWTHGAPAQLDMTDVAWVSAGVSAASLGVGLALILGGLADYQTQIETGCPNQDEPRGACVELTDRFGARSTAANLLLIGAALAGATSVALFAASADSGPTASVVIGPDGAGLSWGGRF